MNYKQIICKYSKDKVIISTLDLQTIFAEGAVKQNQNDGQFFGQV